MAFELTWSSTARLDLVDLRETIADADPEAADRFVRRLFQAVERLVDFPESGRVVPEFNDPEIREVIRRPCRIVYRIRKGDQQIQIVRVWHAARGTPDVPSP